MNFPAFPPSSLRYLTSPQTEINTAEKKLFSFLRFSLSFSVAFVWAKINNFFLLSHCMLAPSAAAIPRFHLSVCYSSRASIPLFPLLFRAFSNNPFFSIAPSPFSSSVNVGGRYILTNDFDANRRSWRKENGEREKEKEASSKSISSIGLSTTSRHGVPSAGFPAP